MGWLGLVGLLPLPPHAPAPGGSAPPGPAGRLTAAGAPLLSAARAPLLLSPVSAVAAPLQFK